MNKTSMPKRLFTLTAELLLLFALTALATPAAAASPQEVTLEKIMSHPDWIGAPPEDPYWADDGRAVYFERKRAGSEIDDLYRLELDPANTTQPVRVSDEERGKADVE